MQILILLGQLPARAAGDEAEQAIDKAAYYLALEGTTKHGLFEAAKAILRGALGHVYFPNPVELRQQHDKAMQHHERMRQRVWLQERIARETPPEVPPRTEAEKARAREVMAEFHASFEREKRASIEAERAEIRARYGLTAEAVASIPDQPLPDGMAQVGQFKKSAA